MARVTIEDCLVKIPNRFEMVSIAAKRARQIAIDGASPLVSSEKNNKVAVTVLREIAEGHISPEGLPVEIETQSSEESED